MRLGLSWGSDQGRTDQFAKHGVRGSLRSHKLPELTHELAAVGCRVALRTPAFVAWQKTYMLISKY